MEQADMTKIDQSLLENLSFGLLLLETDDRISWANAGAARLLGKPVAELIGRAAGDVATTMQPLLGSEPRLLQDAGGKRWLRRELHSGSGGQRLLVLADVTAQQQLADENSRLHQQVEDLQLTDELTGLPNKRAISQALDLHISRSRRYQNPLSVVLVHVDLQKADDVQPLSPDPVTLSVSRFLRDRLRWVDQIARWEDKMFLLVLPETAEADARGLLNKIAAEQDYMVLPEALGKLRPQLTFGMACWTKGDDIRTLLRKALRDLQEVSGTGQP
jgi:diguanylate cyclase (GGDEF)-like protein